MLAVNLPGVGVEGCCPMPSLDCRPMGTKADLPLDLTLDLYAAMGSAKSRTGCGPRHPSSGLDGSLSMLDGNP